VTREEIQSIHPEIGSVKVTGNGMEIPLNLLRAKVFTISILLGTEKNILKERKGEKDKVEI
jgi:hypothetical protein